MTRKAKAVHLAKGRQGARAATGMRAERWHQGEPATAGSTFWERRGRTFLTATSAAALVAGFVVHVVAAGGVVEALGSEGLGVAHQVPVPARVLYTIAIVAGGWFVAPKGWFALRQLRPDMNLLMTIAAVGAIAIGEWEEGSSVLILFAIGLTLQTLTVNRTRRAIQALLQLAPQEATVRRGGGEMVVGVAEVQIGEEQDCEADECKIYEPLLPHRQRPAQVGQQGDVPEQRRLAEHRQLGR